MKKLRNSEASTFYSEPTLRLVDITPRVNVCQEISGMVPGGNSGDDDNDPAYVDDF